MARRLASGELTAPLSKADPSQYKYVSAAPGLLTAANAAPAAPPATQATAQPAAPPATQATAQPAAQPAAPPATQATAQPATPPAATQSKQPLLASTFDQTSQNPWNPLSGDWQAHDGIYSQRDNSGYDFISMMNLAPKATMRSNPSCGWARVKWAVAYLQRAQPTTRLAQIVDFDNKGGFLRWGRYDDKNAYNTRAASADPPISDGQWHVCAW